MQGRDGPVLRGRGNSKRQEEGWKLGQILS